MKQKPNIQMSIRVLIIFLFVKDTVEDYVKMPYKMKRLDIQTYWIQCYFCPSDYVVQDVLSFSRKTEEEQDHIIAVLSQCGKFDGGEYLCYTRFGCAKYNITGFHNNSLKQITLHWRKCLDYGEFCHKTNCSLCIGDLCNTGYKTGPGTVPLTALVFLLLFKQ